MRDRRLPRMNAYCHGHSRLRSSVCPFARAVRDARRRTVLSGDQETSLFGGETADIGTNTQSAVRSRLVKALPAVSRQVTRFFSESWGRRRTPVLLHLFALTLVDHPSGDLGT